MNSKFLSVMVPACFLLYITGVIGGVALCVSEVGEITQNSIDSSIDDTRIANLDKYFEKNPLADGKSKDWYRAVVLKKTILTTGRSAKIAFIAYLETGELKTYSESSFGKRSALFDLKTPVNGEVWIHDHDNNKYLKEMEIELINESGPPFLNNQ